MIRMTRFLALVVCFLASISAFSQKISNKGKDFWVGYGHHQFMETATDNSMNMTLYLSVEDLPAGLTYATVTVTIDSSGFTPALWWKRTYHIAKNTVISIDNSATPAFSFSPAAALSWGPIPKGPVNAAASNTSTSFDARLYTDVCPAGTGGFGLFRKKGIHITSDVEIVAYSHIYGSVSSGATMLLPTTSWGYSYTTINSRQGDAAGAYNFFYVLAQEDNTKVKITGSQAPRYKAGCTFVPPTAGVPFYVTLNKGQIFQYVGDADAAGNGVQLTGSRVESVPNSLGQCKKIAVFAGSSRTSGEDDGGCSSSSRDNDMQQCFPEHTWGKRYLATPFATSSGSNINANVFAGSSYKIVCQDTGTRVRINGGPIINIPLGSYYQFTNATPNYIESNKPIMVGQFMTSGNCGTGQGDPAVVYLSPLEQAIPKVGLYRNTKESITANFVNIVVPDAGYNSLRIDNQGPPLFGGNSATIQIPNYAGAPGFSGYKMVIKGWPATRAQTLIKCDTNFNVITYGLGGAESYAYNGGAYFNNLRAVGDQWNPKDTTKNQDSINIKGHNQAYYSNQVASPVLLRLICGDSVKIISWNFSQTIDTNKITIINKRTGLANKNLVDYHPVVLTSSLVNGKRTNYKYQCPDTMLIYRKNLTTSVPPLQLDTFYVPVTVHSIDSVQLYTAPVNSCNGSYGSLGDTIPINYSITNGGGITIIADVPACGTDSTAFKGPDSINFGILREKIVSWNWLFEDGSTSQLQNPIRVLTKDTNKVKLEVITSSGLVSVKLDTVYSGFKVKFSAPDKVCVNQPVRLIDSTNRTNIDSCIWGFGGSTRFSDPSCQPFQYTFTSPGTYVIWHTISLLTPCPIDTAFKTIIVSSKRYPEIQYTNPCADTTGIANFNANLGVGGVPIKNYLWNFGQPSSGAADSSKINPTTHNYGVEGDYVVRLNVIDTLGCLGDTTQTIAIKIKPSIYFKSLPVKYCINNGSISFASLAGCYNQSKVLGAGVFSGPGIDASGNFDPIAAGTGINTIWYVYTTSKGCKDSLSQQINVVDKPTVAFDYTQGCLPKDGVAQFTNFTSLGFSFLWNFDDAAHSTTSNPNIVDSINPSHVFANTGLHNVKLYAETADGCKDSLTKAITFSVTPDVRFAPITSVCENQVNVNVALGSVANGVMGMDSIYYGPGTTSSGTLSPAISSWGNHTITYVYTSTGGCKDSATQTILVKARPRLGFAYPAGCLPANGNVQFTDTTKLPDGQTIQSCGWTFGDPNATTSNPNTASVCSPSHNFNYGTYIIYHTVTSSLGCVTDTTFTANFSVSPDLFYNAITPVCENLTTYSVANAGSNNLAAAPGSGVYQGAGIINTNTGEFNPNLAGAGTHPIYYVFTATSGCVARDTQTVVVKPRPKGQFTFTPNTGCLNSLGTVQFNAGGISIASPASITNYTWNFGDASTSGTGVSPTHNYNDGTYNIALNIQANNGCSFDTSMSQTFSKTPDLAPLQQGDTCENIGIITLRTPAILNGAIGSGVFSSYKNAVTNATLGTYDPSIAGYGIDTIYYNFTSTGGCTAQRKLAINILGRPRGGFSFSPNTGCLNSAGFVQFTGNISVPNSSVQTYTWNFGDLSAAGSGVAPTHNYNDGTYTIALNVKGNNGCSFDTSMSQTFSKTPDLAPLQQGDTCENIGIITLRTPAILNGAIGSGVFSSYKNAVTNATLGTYDPSIAGYGIDTIYYNFTSTGGCTAQRKLAINILGRPRGGFSFSPNTGCLNSAGFVQFTGNISVPNSSVQTYTWNFGDLSAAGSGVAPTHNYNDGTYTIALNVKGNNGCSFDTSMSQTFSKTPDLAPLQQGDTCENIGIITLRTPAILNGAIGSGVFSSYKNAVTNATLGTYDPSIAGYGIDTIYYNFTSTGGCTAQRKLAIRILGRPRGQFTFTPNTGCLDVTGLVKFNANGISVPGSFVQTYNWQYEASLAPVSAGATPSYTYADGTYDIKLNAIGFNGCSFDTMMTQKFSRTPSLDPIVITNVCSNSSAFPINPPAVNNGVLGNAGTFSSFKNAIVGANTYDPALAGYSIDTVYYKFTAFSGCEATVKKVVNIFPVPKAVINVKPYVCIDSVVTFKDFSTLATGSISTRNWDFGDGSAVVVNPMGNIITHGFPATQAYSVTLTVTSDSGCVATAQVDVTARPKPVAQFKYNPIVCMPNGTAFFTNQSSVAANGGTLTYAWTFGDPNANTSNPNTSSLSDPRHMYSTIQSYPIKLVVTTKPYNCQDIFYDTLYPKEPFFNKPIAKFGVSKDTLCENEPSYFTDSSSAPNSSLFSWTWNYGDGSTPNTTTVPYSTYSYPLADSFKASLTVRNTELCESDPYYLDVLVYPQPQIDSMNQIIVLQNTIVQFNPTVADTTGIQYYWTALMPPYSVAGLSNPDTLYPYLTATQTQGYILNAIGKGNCYASRVQYVKVLEKIVIPNAFSPNGDGINDTWKITSLGDYPGATLDIFDRYGMKVKHLSGNIMEWDGTLNGTPMPVATYYYIIDPGNKLEKITGWVVLLR